MAITETQLIGFVLNCFRAVGTGQAPAADDVTFVQGYLGPVLANISASVPYYIADSDSVPDEAATWVAAIIARHPGIADHFGEMKLDVPTLEYAETRLRRMISSQDSSVLMGVYF